jgi:hypothetical protein
MDPRRLGYAQLLVSFNDLNNLSLNELVSSPLLKTACTSLVVAASETNVLASHVHTHACSKSSNEITEGKTRSIHELKDAQFIYG